MLLNGVESTAAKSPDNINAGTAFAMSLAEQTSFLLARALSLTGKRELAEDLVQETMANAWQARRSFIPGTNLKAWLCKILRNEFYSHQRRAWRQAPWCTMFEETIPSPPGQQLSAIDLCEAACAMNALPDPQRESLILVGICGFSYEETALLLGGTLGTVKSRVARARLSLLQILQSRRLRRVKLHPANCNAFDEWLVQLDQLRIAACHLLDRGAAKEFHNIAKVPKIPVQTVMGPPGTDDRVTEANKFASDVYEALGSPRTVSGDALSSSGGLASRLERLTAPADTPRLAALAAE